MTGSVGLLSDAVESVVNLIAALVALWALWLASRPADEDHHYGHTKAEYFSSGVEGALILVAAASIAAAAWPRLLHPQPLEQIGAGLLVSAAASVINGAVAAILWRAGKERRSVTLTADARHLMTDVWTTVGVIVALRLVEPDGLVHSGPDHRAGGGGERAVDGRAADPRERAGAAGYRDPGGGAGDHHAGAGSVAA